MPAWQKAVLAVGGSVLLHVIAAFLLGQAAKFRPPPPPQKPVEVSVVEVQKPKPPEAPPPPPVEVKKPPPQPVVHVLKPPPKTVEPPTPPPPNQQPKPNEKPPETAPVVLPGVTLESTSDKGSFSVNTGNTLYGKPDTKGHDPSDVHPYKAQKFVAASRISTQPELLNGETVNVRDFYPAEAMKADFEGEVTLRLMIDSDGSVVVAKSSVLVDPGMGLGAVALKLAEEKYKFSPATLDGEPVATTVTFKVLFQLNH
jgi:TonB family protein